MDRASSRVFIDLSALPSLRFQIEILTGLFVDPGGVGVLGKGGRFGVTSDGSLDAGSEGGTWDIGPGVSDLVTDKGAPQWGQNAACVETEFPHSEQDSNISYLRDLESFNSC